MTPTPRIAKKMMFHIVFGDNTDDNFTINKIIFFSLHPRFYSFDCDYSILLAFGPGKLPGLWRNGPKGRDRDDLTKTNV